MYDKIKKYAESLIDYPVNEKIKMVEFYIKMQYGESVYDYSMAKMMSEICGRY